MITHEIRHFHLFCGLGAGAKGFNRGKARVGNTVAKFRCLGGVDNDPAAIRDFGRQAGVPGTLLDMFDRDQYIGFHGHEPPADWREATPADIRRAAGGERPHIVFLSAPCKGFSGLLSEAKSKTTKYVALNRLTLRGVWLMLEAWADDPPELIVFENVPRLLTRGRLLVDQIMGLLRSYGYAAAETTHDCGKLGGLAQSRKRCLIVARHIEKVPPMLYEPAMKPLRAVGDVLGRMLLPGDLRAGPMHRVPQLQWKTWVRLAFVEAGSDWRSLNKLAIEDGKLRDYLIVPEMRRGVYGVRDWTEPMGVVAGESRPSNGAFSIADPRVELHAKYTHGGFRVVDWEGNAGTVTGAIAPGSSAQSVNDPRCPETKHNNCFRVVRFEHPAGTITAGAGPSAGGQAVADPRADTAFSGAGKYRVTGYEETAGAVIAASTTGQGAFAVADPRPKPGPLFSKYPVTPWDASSGTVIGGDDTGAYAVADPRSGMQGDRANYLTGGHYGVVPWTDFTGAVSGSACLDSGPWSVADPRMPTDTEKLVARIRSLDGTWHRPFTTLELAALQSLVEPEEQLELDGLSDSAWRERIGNAVPPDAAEAIANEMGRTLLLAFSGETFQLSASPIWVRPIAIAISVARGDLA